MTTSDRIAWALAGLLCVVLPLATDEPGLALAGGGALAVLAWLLRKDKLL